MPGKDTIVLLIHGANQSEKDDAKNLRTWEEAFAIDDNARKVDSLIKGHENDAIKYHHERNHQNRDYPQYVGRKAIWYGDIWANLSATGEANRFERRLNVSTDEDNDDRNSILEKIQRGAMQRHFDELVPFYELAVQKHDGRTLYEAICDRFLGQLIQAADGGEHYALVGHSMGCAVSYNVMSHISCAKSNVDYCPITNTLSNDYRNKVNLFANSRSKCFGLMTFGNYIGYNWCQRLNNKILFGDYKKQYVYPDAVGRWFNYWTVLGGDPYIIDDQLEDNIVSDEHDHYDDVPIFRIPFSQIGHGRAKWFRRKKFTQKLRSKMAYHLYL